MGSLENLALREVALTRCSFYTNEIAKVQARLVDAVDYARHVGCSWDEIGKSVGTSHQAVINRFSKIVTPVDLRSSAHPRRVAVREQKGWKNPESNGAE